MAGTATYTVVLDANVLYPISVIDLILSLAGTNLFHARSDFLIPRLLRSLCCCEPITMLKPPTGDPCAGEPHARFGGRGGRELFPTPIGVFFNTLLRVDKDKFQVRCWPWIPAYTMPV